MAKTRHAIQILTHRDARRRPVIMQGGTKIDTFDHRVINGLHSWTNGYGALKQMDTGVRTVVIEYRYMVRLTNRRRKVRK